MPSRSAETQSCPVENQRLWFSNPVVGSETGPWPALVVDAVRMRRKYPHGEWRQISSNRDPAPIAAPSLGRYFSAVEIDEKVLLRWVPSPVITGMIATAIPAAMRPYSMAVAADSSFRKIRIFSTMLEK
jgi:hypothetical protein